jgi:UDP-N-acetylglucosamine diphosphorylase / glucose-1-phosphate thymidylyltransferase / UDP-N-acetylgalactosamine diphosphorylase / glucosamine-1-phosphate N-acetyltransferase / galactosamine-1-phosphate N-acetyltransferase
MTATSDLSPRALFDLDGIDFADLFDGLEFAWEALRRLPDWMKAHVRSEIRGEVAPGAFVAKEGVFVAEGAVVEPTAWVAGPTILGPGTVVRHGAYVRGNVLCGRKCVIGHTTEAKGSIFLDGAKAPHFAYVGDSILGRDVNLGAGTKLSNLKMLGKTVTLRWGDRVIDTGLRKFGAVIGDGSETGCNSVLSPGVVLGKGCMVYPCMHARGYHPSGTVLKLRQGEETVARR